MLIGVLVVSVVALVVQRLVIEGRVSCVLLCLAHLLMV